MGLTPPPFWTILKKLQRYLLFWMSHLSHKKWWWMYYFKLRDLNVWGGEYPNSLDCYETVPIVSDQLNSTRFCAWVDLTRWNEKCNFLGTIRQTLPFPLHSLLKPILQALCHFEDISIEQKSWNLDSIFSFSRWGVCRSRFIIWRKWNSFWGKSLYMCFQMHNWISPQSLSSQNWHN